MLVMEGERRGGVCGGRAPGGGGDDHALGRGGGRSRAAGPARHLDNETHGGGGALGSHPASDIERDSEKYNTFITLLHIEDIFRRSWEKVEIC